MSHVRAKRKHAAAPGGGHCRGQYHDYDYDDESHDEEAEDEEEEEAVYDYQDASDVIVSDEDDDDVKKDDLLPTNQVLPAEYLASLKPAADRRRQMMFMVMDVILQKGGGQTKKTGQRSTDAVLFGRGELGASVCVVVSGWLPYLLIAAPVGWVNTADNCEALRSLLDERLSAYLAMHYEDPGKIIATKPVRQQAKKLGFVCRVSMEAQKSIMGYTEGGPTPHLKIEVAHPHLVRCLHDVFVGYPVPPPPPPPPSSAICSDADDVKRASSSSRKKEERIKGTIVRIQPWSGGWPVLGDGYTETFNSNLDAVLQFMVDVGLWGCQWCRMGEEVEAVADHRESYSNNDVTVDGGWANPKISHCDYEYHVGIDALHFIAHEDMPCFAPLRILSFDIEAAGRRGVFPQAEIDPVIQIGIHFHVLADADSETIRPGLKPVLLSFQKCDEIGEEADVFSFDDERMMLLAFKEIVMAFDVDIFTGYNVCGFDFGYLKTRAVTLGCALAEPNDQSLREGEVGEEGERFDLMTRLLKSQGSASSLGIKETEYFSVQMGKQRRVKVSVAGRGVLDMLLAIRNDQSYRLEKYSLDFVSSYFLGDHKKDVHFTQITPMWMEGPASRRMLGEYCLQDAKLPVDLMIKVDSLTQTIEMARAVGVPFDYVMQRGQMIRTTSLLLRRSKERQFIFPNRNPFARQSALAATALTASAASATTSVPNNKNKGYQGATVLEPECGLHRFVGVVDFSAMYPSIMMAHNICASTIILDKHHPLVTGSSSSSSEDEVLRVCGHVFVSASRVKGLIPDVVETLQICRGKAKKAFAAATDPFKKKIARASELAYKAASNSVYGFFGSDLSILSIKALAESVTAVGRNDIMIVKGMAEKMYPEGLVVYGDTDSVFIRHSLPAEMADGPTVDAVMEASQRTIALADAVNAVMKRPKKLEFEKVYGAMLLLSKKRYGGLLFKPDHKWGTQPPIDIKGLQSQRRDGCPLVRDLVRDCLTSILHTGSHVDAAGLVRLRLLEIMEDKVPLDVYAIQKTLRKSMQDVCHPMQPEEVARVREALHAKKQNSERTASARISGGQTAQLSYAEQDEAIRWKIKLPWRIRVRLPHVMLAYRLRQQDVGAAPVSGDTIRYIVTNNGGIKIWEKVETLESVRMKHTAVDRNYYIQSLRTPILNLFLPIFTQNLKMQQSGGGGGGGETSESEKKRRMHEAALAAAESALFDVIKQRPMLHEPATRKARLEASAIAMAFAKQHKARAAETKKK